MIFLSSCASPSSEEGNLDKEIIDVPLGQAVKVSFTAKDGLPVTADFYQNPNAKSIIILCHQARFSRGEYNEIAPRLVDSGYACLSVDLRSGNLVNEVINETAAAAKAKGLEVKYMDAMQDIEAAIEYVAQNSKNEIYLWGSSYSASLVLMIAKKDARIKRVVAFSPGEYFSNQNVVRPKVIGLNTPCFISGSSAEFDKIVKPIINVMPRHNVVSYKPKVLTEHGSKTLWTSSNGYQETYKALFEFL